MNNEVFLENDDYMTVNVCIVKEKTCHIAAKNFTRYRDSEVRTDLLYDDFIFHSGERVCLCFLQRLQILFSLIESKVTCSEGFQIILYICQFVFLNASNFAKFIERIIDTGSLPDLSLHFFTVEFCNQRCLDIPLPKGYFYSSHFFDEFASHLKLEAFIHCFEKSHILFQVPNTTFPTCVCEQAQAESSWPVTNSFVSFKCERCSISLPFATFSYPTFLGFKFFPFYWNNQQWLFAKFRRNELNPREYRSTFFVLFQSAPLSIVRKRTAVASLHYLALGSWIYHTLKALKLTILIIKSSVKTLRLITYDPEEWRLVERQLPERFGAPSHCTEILRLAFDEFLLRAIFEQNHFPTPFDNSRFMFYRVLGSASS